MNNSSILTALALATGALVPFQLSFNAQLGSVTKSPFTAALIVFMLGAVTLAILVAATRQALPAPVALASAPFTVWLGGFIAVMYILAVVSITPRLGVGTTAVFIISGQILMALALDHLGAFGNPQHSFNAWRAVGAVSMILGVSLIRTH